MNNNARTYIVIVALVIVGLAVMTNKFFSPEKRNMSPGTIREGITKQMTLDNQPGYNPAYRSSHDHLLFLTFGAALTIGCLAGIYIRRRPRRPESSRPDEIDNLSGISADMGINEYDLFHKAAENWAVPAERIEEDFSAYLATQRLPYYVTDYARKSHSQPDEMPTEKETEPSTWSDWMKALLVFPGVFVFIYVAMVFLP
jgi:hypothetical protein